MVCVGGDLKDDLVPHGVCHWQGYHLSLCYFLKNRETIASLFFLRGSCLSFFEWRKINFHSLFDLLQSHY